MSNKDDILGNLLNSKSTRKNATAPAGSESDKAGNAGSTAPNSYVSSTNKGQEKPQVGMTSLDLLALPADWRRIVNWLSRKKQANLEEIKKGVSIDSDEVERVLKELREANYVVQNMVGDEMYYRIVFRSARKKANGLLGELWSRMEMDDKTFLKQHPLFQDLTDDQLQDVVNKLEERIFSRDDVILIQGEVSEHLYIIKSGVVGISRYTVQNKDKKILSYMKSGDILGENNVLLRQGGAATANATALSTVSVLCVKKDTFVQLLNEHPAIAVELARLLVQRLIATNTRFQNTSGAKLCLVIGIGTEVGATSVGAIMAMTLAQTTRKHTVYTELPNPDHLANEIGADPEVGKIQHPGNFDVVVTQDSPGLPATLRATLAFDRLISSYEMVVIGLTSASDEAIVYLAEHADQIIIVTTPTKEKWDEFGKLTQKLRSVIHPERVSLFHIMNRTKLEQKGTAPLTRVDFDLPYQEHMIPWTELRLDNRPQVLAMMATSLADRIGRANQVSVYIPTTIDVDQFVDTTQYVQRTLAFLGERFGGATTNKAQGVWNSTDSGLVGEDIHIVRSYATQDALDQHLQSILDYVEGLKKELRQEAMAVEINQKLMLI